MFRINFFFFLFSLIFFSYAPSVKKENEAFRKDLLEVLPAFDFNESNLYSLIAFFKVYSTKSLMSKLNKLQIKYSHNIEVVRKIYFLKLLVLFVAKNHMEYKKIYLEYCRVLSENSKYSKYIHKLNFIFEDKMLSNNSDYCIEIKRNNYYQYKQNGLNDFYLDELVLIMELAHRLIKLKIFMSIYSKYGMNWIEGVWSAFHEIEKGTSLDLDVYYFFLIEFFNNQDMQEEGDLLKEQMELQCPDSELLNLLNF